MVKQALVSRHIVLTNNIHSNKPVYGIILIEDEIIFDIVIIDTDIGISSVIDKYQDWNPENLENFYISPGIIDLNTRLEWETYTELTKAAISGGVTFSLIESGYYMDPAPTGEMFCDIGKVATLEISTMETIPFLNEQGYLAVKGYLFPPYMAVQCIPSNLLPVLQEVEKTPLTFFIDPNLPDPRMLHSVSPYRLRPLKDRLTDTHESSSFSGAFPDLIEDEEEDDESPQLPKLQSRKSVANDLRKRSSPLYKDERSNSDEYTMTTNRKTSELVLDIDEIKEVDEQFSNLMSKKIRKSNTNTIFDDLDKRIKESQMSIQNLSHAEFETYKEAGVTHFISPIGLNPNPMNFPNSPMSDTSSVDISYPTSPKPSILQRRKIAGSLSLVIKPTITSKENLYCYHMANYSQTWEHAGITKLLEALKKSNCRVHVCNISAASSLNKIRQAKEWCKRLTCEIPASHLTFSSMTIPENDTRFKCYPPIRNQANTNLLWDLLKMKGIDAITSGHAAVCNDFKIIKGNFRKAVNGFPAIGFSLQAVWTTLNGPVSSHAQLEHYIVRLAKWLSLYPAEILNISSTRGSISKGKYADLIVWNPYEKFLVTEEYSPYPQMSPFFGTELYGKICRVYLRGNIAYSQGKFKARGRHVLRISQ
ncbi:hypothetical protein SteCoe_2000 [Stentor coeruleus]|uniref:Amidohydrolase-related domain-containing protein n=1 Tax=Stentor coeruleus TaxID=5963 RepID=A0A1R2D0P2_9CILI|nr:hypothetical protein SteCoe_2000 [Stentor coeruleus]